ncbi:MAG: chloride channel protein [Lactobacillus delbrueckii]
MTISSELISLFWSKRTLTHPGLLLLQCLLFGPVIGLLQLKVGAYPKTIKQILAEFQKTGKVEGASWRTWVNGTIILAGGASVGPEASMTGIIARQSSAMGQQLTNYLTDPDLPQAPFKEQFKALFRPLTPAEGPLKAVFAKKWRQKASYIIWTCLGICSFAMWLKAFPEAKVFQIGFAEVNWTWQGILLTPLAFALGLAFGKFFLKFEEIGEKLGETIPNYLLKGMLGGLLLGIGGLLSSYLLWSGAFTMWNLVDQAAKLGPVFLISLAFGKCLLTNFGFGLGWRGGTIFPAIFCSVALGLGLALLLPWSQNLLVAVLTAASVSVIVGKPKLVALLLVFLFSLRLAPVIILVCLLCEKIPQGKPLFPRK